MKRVARLDAHEQSGHRPASGRISCRTRLVSCIAQDHGPSEQFQEPTTMLKGPLSPLSVSASAARSAFHCVLTFAILSLHVHVRKIPTTASFWTFPTLAFSFTRTA